MKILGHMKNQFLSAVQLLQDGLLIWRHCMFYRWKQLPTSCLSVACGGVIKVDEKVKREGDISAINHPPQILWKWNSLLNYIPQLSMDKDTDDNNEKDIEMFMSNLTYRWTLSIFEIRKGRSIIYGLLFIKWQKLKDGSFGGDPQYFINEIAISH